MEKILLEEQSRREKILNSIRQRKTHNNIMRSGIGVGGYCLTKDPFLQMLHRNKYYRKI